MCCNQASIPRYLNYSFVGNVADPEVFIINRKTVIKFAVEVNWYCSDKCCIKSVNIYFFVETVVYIEVFIVNVKPTVGCVHVRERESVDKVEVVVEIEHFQGEVVKKKDVLAVDEYV